MDSSDSAKTYEDLLTVLRNTPNDQATAILNDALRDLTRWACERAWQDCLDAVLCPEKTEPVILKMKDLMFQKWKERHGLHEQESNRN